MSVLMIFSSCSMDIPYEDTNENTETVEEPKEDNSENNEDEPSNEEPKEDNSENNEVVEDKIWCEIGEDINILELNYIGYYENFTAIFNSDTNDSKLVKTTPFT